MKNFITLKGLVFILTTILCFSFATIKNYEHRNDSSVLHLVKNNEKGEHIIINGLLKDKKSEKPLKNITLFFFQADSEGNYQPKLRNDERSAKISGQVTTDDKGRFTIQTIMPGNYPNAPKGRAHIHVDIKKSNNDRIVKDILFDHDVSNDVRKWANETGNGIIIFLNAGIEKRTADLIISI